MSKKRIESVRQILKSFTNDIPEQSFDLTAFVTEVNRAKKAIDKVETELARELAVLEFLDLRYNEVKVSKRVAKVPAYARSITK